MPPQIDFDPSVDYYKALGVESKANADEIKRAYRKLAKQFHPDTTGGDKTKESRFKDVQNAYDVLGDAQKKQLYDDIRAGGDLRGTYTRDSPFNLNDLFSEFFSGQNGFSNGPMPGAARGRVRVERIHFDDGDVDAEFESRVQASDGTWLHVDGKDVYSDVRISFDRAIQGTIASVATIDGKADVKIPPGTSSGKKLRLRGKGVVAATMGGKRFGHAGDHYVTVQIDVPSALDEDAKKLLAQLVRKLDR